LFVVIAPFIAAIQLAQKPANSILIFEIHAIS
jgi:hypothetical protein